MTARRSGRPLDNCAFPGDLAVNPSPSAGVLLKKIVLFIVLVVTWIVLVGIRETARFNTALVVGKVIIVLFFLAIGTHYVRA